MTVVVKLGGSHALSPLLGGWLAAIGRAAGRVVVVPGGGPFAETVRTAQAAMRFDDAAAHDMALMAMAQYGRALVSLAPGFVVAADAEAVRTALAQRRVPVWSPWPMLRAQADIPPSWEVTSDSLSLWLARRLGARRVVLIKHRAAPGDMATMIREGFVDAACGRFAAAYSGQLVVAGPDDLARAGALFDGDAAAAAA